MSLNVLLSTVILISFIVTVVLAIGSYTAYKLRERRRPKPSLAPEDAAVYFERYLPPSAVPPSERRAETAAPVDRA